MTYHPSTTLISSSAGLCGSQVSVPRRTYTETAAENEGANYPAERLNDNRCSDCWLTNLLVAASLGGTKN